MTESDYVRTIGLAHGRMGCVRCFGTGVGRRSPWCWCTLHVVADAVCRRYRFSDWMTHQNPVRNCFGEAHFRGDVHNLARRSLSPVQLAIFNEHLIAGVPWRSMCRRLKTDKGSFFHEVYRTKRTFGLAALLLRPWPLYPLELYFSPFHMAPLEPGGKLFRLVTISRRHDGEGEGAGQCLQADLVPSLRNNLT